LKAGLENRKAVIVMAGLLLVAGFTMYWTFSTPDPQAAGAPADAPAAQAPDPRRPERGKSAQLASNLDPTLRFDLLKASEETPYRGRGRNIFKPQADPPPPIPQPVQAPMAVSGPPPPPPPPPINLKFFGFANKTGEARRVFLSQGDVVFIAGEGEIVNRRYRVVRISPASVEIEDVLTNHSEHIPLSQG
jgi:hypothetical protein